MKLYLAVLTIFGWFALISQLYLILISGAAAPAELIIRYFSYFTITTNLIVAVCATTLLLFPKTNTGSFFGRADTITALTVYIVVVGITYNLILRSLWQPQGLQKVVDELLHSVIPLLFLIYWFVFAPKNNLPVKSFLVWLIYPLIYTIYILIRGSLSGFYPYPFMDVTQLGYNRVLINSAIVTSAFIVVSLLLTGIAKLQSRI